MPTVIKAINLGKAKSLSTSLNAPKQEKANIQLNKLPAGACKSLKGNQKKNNITLSNLTTLKMLLIFCFIGLPVSNLQNFWEKQ